MRSRTVICCAAVWCIVVVSMLSGEPAPAPPSAGAPGEAQKKAAAQAAPAEPAPPVVPERFIEPAELGERIDALEKQNLVLREDLGKALLDARTRLLDAEKRQAETAARLQQRIDDLNAQLAVERERQARRSRNLWLAVGVLAIGIIAAD